MATKASLPRARVAIIAPDDVRRAAPAAWLAGFECHWRSPATVGPETREDGSGEWNVRVWFNADPPAGAPGAGTTLEVRAGLAPGGGGERLLVATVRHRPPGSPGPALLCRTTAPVYPADTRGDLLARSQELGLRALGVVLGRTAWEAAANPTATREVRVDPAIPLRTVGDVPGSLAARHAAHRLLSRLRPRSLAKEVLLRLALSAYRPLRDLARTARRRHPVRIFTFHRVSDLCRDSLTVSRRTFAAQARRIARTHRVVGLEEALGLLASGARLRRPVAALTFDDAYRSVRDNAAPVLADLGLPACCFAPTAWIASDGRFPWDADNPAREHLEVMDWGELRALRDDGWSIGGHTATHARLAECDDPSLERELAGPLADLERRLGIRAPAMAYPFGGPRDVDVRGLRRVESLGYAACLSNHGGENRPWAAPSPFRLARIDIGADLPPLVWKGRVHGIDSSRWLRRIPEPDAARRPEPGRP